MVQHLIRAPYLHVSSFMKPVEKYHKLISSQGAGGSAMHETRYIFDVLLLLRLLLCPVT
jgi:hypothetical protein